LQGAIDEIELFVTTLHQYEKKHVHTNFESKPQSEPEKVGIFKRVSRIFKADRPQLPERDLGLSSIPIDQVTQ